MVQTLFQALRIISLNQVDEVHDLKEFILWREETDKQINLLGLVLIRAMKINKAQRELEAREVFYGEGRS